MLPLIRRVTRRRCYACRAGGVPLTPAQFCPTCADIVCRIDSGERAGLPVPSNVPAAVTALEQHHLGCTLDRRACWCARC
ncbi:hypothetical protein BJF78_14045 [Pseudonocardia sp. CNS-139]|nr:hypothetical protein BJF78_14045 [Pseudonocardia sp. CNS-139]